jgi:hypothetical protein
MAKHEDPKTRARRAKGEDTLTPASELVKGLMQNVQNPLAVGFLRLKLEVQWAEIVGPSDRENDRPSGFFQWRLRRLGRPFGLDARALVRQRRNPG